MKLHTKKTLKSGIFAGIGFGIITAGIDYFDGDGFELWKFVFKVFFFGLFMGIYFNYSLKKKSEKESK